MGAGFAGAFGGLLNGYLAGQKQAQELALEKARENRLKTQQELEAKGLDQRLQEHQQLEDIGKGITDPIERAAFLRNPSAYYDTYESKKRSKALAPAIAQLADDPSIPQDQKWKFVAASRMLAGGLGLDQIKTVLSLKEDDPLNQLLKQARLDTTIQNLENPRPMVVQGSDAEGRPTSYLVNPRTRAFEPYGGAGTPTAPSGMSPVGSSASAPPLAGAPFGVTAGGFGMRKPLGQNELKQLDSVNNAEQMTSNLRADVTALGTVTPGELAKQYARYRMPFGIAGAPDPRFAAYFNHLGQLQTDLIQAAMGSSRAYQLAHELMPHIPSPFDPPARALEKMRGFQSGRFRALKETLLGGGAPTGGAAAPAGGDPDMPPASLIPDGTRRKINGKWYRNRGGVVSEVPSELASGK